VILVLPAPGLGDLASAVPALRGLRARYAGEHIVLVAPAWLAPLVDLIGGIDEVVLDARLPRSAVAVNLHGRGPESHRRLRTTEPGELWAFANRDAGHIDGPVWIEEEPEVHRWARMLDHYGVVADRSDLALAVPSHPVRALQTIIHPGAKSPSRRWPATRYAAVARALAEDGHHVVVTGSAGERDIAARVVLGAGLPARANLAGRTGVGELAGLVAHARLVISGDTGIARLATAYRTPSVVLCGPASDRPYHRAIWHGTAAALPPQSGDAPGPAIHPALLGIAVDEVLAAAGEVERARHAVAAQ
jgi:ADP-heptose:LPS heptosyltransferase